MTRDFKMHELSSLVWMTSGPGSIFHADSESRVENAGGRSDVLYPCLLSNLSSFDRFYRNFRLDFKCLAI